MWSWYKRLRTGQCSPSCHRKKKRLAHPFETDEVVLIETNLDDYNPEYFEVVSDQLFAQGALDVYCHSIQMKKQRPGLLIGVLCSQEHVETLSKCLFTETTAIGVRTQNMARLKLSRKTVEWESPYGQLTYKIAFSGDQIYGIYPEYESLKLCAIHNKIPIKVLYALTPEIDLFSDL